MCCRSYLERYLPPGGAELVLQRALSLGEMVELEEPYPAFSDPDDAYLLAMLRDSDAELLVTGDGTLHALGEFQGKPVLTPTEFPERLRR